MSATTTRCKDCKAEGLNNKRPIVEGSGGRCATHWSATRKSRSAASHARGVEKRFGITGEQYWSLYESQGGRCYICGIAQGKRKRLAVEHDHGCTAGHDPKTGCPLCIRGLCCSVCNKFIGYVRDNPMAFIRGYVLLTDPPARKVLSQ